MAETDSPAAAADGLLLGLLQRVRCEAGAGECRAAVLKVQEERRAAAKLGYSVSYAGLRAQIGHHSPPAVECEACTEQIVERSGILMVLTAAGVS